MVVRSFIHRSSLLTLRCNLLITIALLCVLSGDRRQVHSLNIDWLRVFDKLGEVLIRLEHDPIIKQISSLDFTAGASTLSTPPKILTPTIIYPGANDAKNIKETPFSGYYYEITKTNNNTLYDNISTSSLANSIATLQAKFLLPPEVSTRPGLQKIHQVSRSFIKKAPDEVLLGVLALISAELIQRGVNKQSHTFPPIVSTLANRTLSELEMKLELLSALQWDLQPFFQKEVENLQTQPIELLDKYIVSEVSSLSYNHEIDTSSFTLIL